MTTAQAVYAPGRPVPVLQILGGLRHGGGDPTWRRDDAGLWLGRRTPEGAATMRLQLRRGAPSEGDVVTASAWGEGADWALRSLPELLGERDDVDGFSPTHPTLLAGDRQHRHYRVPRSGAVLESLVPVVIEQRVTGHEAFRGYRLLVRAYGETAPGPGAERGLMVAPDARGWRRVPSWAWIRAGVDGQRADTVMRCTQVAARLQECVDLPLDEARRRLRAVPGVGVWTAAEVAQRALGDADAVSVGDYHVAHHVTWALEGRVGDDVRMLELLRPYVGHRFRVQRLLQLAGVRAPARGPRMTLPRHLPV